MSRAKTIGMSIRGTTSTGAGEAVDFGEISRAFTVHVEHDAATSVAWRAQGRLGNQGGWVDLGAAATTQASTDAITRSTGAVGVSQVRVNVSAVTGAMTSLVARVAAEF